MNRTGLFNEVKCWLEAEKLSFLADDDETFRLRVNADNGLLEVRLQCEEEPAMLQVICPMPMRVPPEKVPEVGLLLHNINAGLRIGAFQFHLEPRVVAFRLPMLIQSEAELAEQFQCALSTTLNTMDEHLRTLGLLACATPEAQQAVAKLSPAAETLGTTPRLPSGRLELN